MDVNSNVNGLHSEPGFHPEARYEFKVHFDGADFETLTYRISFSEPGPDGHQALQLHALTGEAAREDSAAGLAGSPGAAEIFHAEAAGLDVEDEMRGWLVVAVGDGL